MQELESELRQHLITLATLSTIEEAERVRHEVVARHDEAQALDTNVEAQWAVRRLYDYVNWRSSATLIHGIESLEREQTELDRALLTVLDKVRHADAPETLEDLRTDLTELRTRIQQLDPAADQATALRGLLGYTDTTIRTALEQSRPAEQENKAERLSGTAQAIMDVLTRTVEEDRQHEQDRQAEQAQQVSAVARSHTQYRSRW
ncbi:hypothetical protein [Nocardia sp. XZ_19_385]|uniref:hypothetical protein n=1 Tax=Nocardia sp. XZ_19_385 TaxID=2769488 RepID=UPI001890B4A8|nr:hypothetical protein [Nocardia sp. XZ_19_385]